MASGKQWCSFRGRRHVAAALLASMPLAGCISIGTTPKPDTVLFAANAPAFRPMVRNRSWLGYREPSFAVTQYSAVMIDPVAVSAAGADQLPSGAAGKLAEGLRADLAAALKSLSPARGPGAGVLQVRATITAIGRPRRALNLAMLPTAMVGVPVPLMTSGGAAIEVDVFDSLSGRRIVAFRGRAKGARGPVGSLKAFDHAQNALRVLAGAVADMIADPSALSGAKEAIGGRAIAVQPDPARASCSGMCLLPASESPMLAYRLQPTDRSAV